MDVKILIGVPMGEMGRYNQFHTFLEGIVQPPNTRICKVVGRSAAENRNIIIEESLKGRFSHVLFIDDDMAPEPNILYKLLLHGLPIVTGLYFTRKYPHQPVIFNKFDDNNNIEWYDLKDGETGLIHVDAAGLGACLVETDVFRKMDSPWIRYGEIGKSDSWCHDIGFFRRARYMGYYAWCDLGCQVGHIGETVIRPRHVNDKWHYAYSTDGVNEVYIPQPEIHLV